jgi:ADP-heptose:LPS heptosyltransferase
MMSVAENLPPEVWSYIAEQQLTRAEYKALRLTSKSFHDIFTHRLLGPTESIDIKPSRFRSLQSSKRLPDVKRLYFRHNVGNYHELEEDLLNPDPELPTIKKDQLESFGYALLHINLRF